MGNADAFYAGLAATAQQLLSQFGFLGAIVVKVGEVFDPISGSIVAPAKLVPHPCYAVYGGGGTGKWPGVIKDTEGTTLNRRTKKDVYLDAVKLDIAPTTDMLFQDEAGNTYEITKVEETNPGGPPVLWKISVVR